MYEGMNQRSDVAIHPPSVDKYMYDSTLPSNAHRHTTLINQGNLFC